MIKGYPTVEARDLRTVANLLASDEERVALINGEHYRLIATIAEPARVRVPPFDDLELDLADILGD